MRRPPAARRGGRAEETAAQNMKGHPSHPSPRKKNGQGKSEAKKPQKLLQRHGTNSTKKTKAQQPRGSSSACAPPNPTLQGKA